MAASYVNPAFGWPTLSTRTMSAGTTSTNISFQSSNLSAHVSITNVGTTPAFVEFGESSVAAIIPTGTAVGSIIINSGQTRILHAKYNFVAAIVSAGTATLYITPGDGGI
jgi:hypothetical protein